MYFQFTVPPNAVIRRISMTAWFRRTFDWFLLALRDRGMATESSAIKVHPDTHHPTRAWDKLKVKQKCEKVCKFLSLLIKLLSDSHDITGDMRRYTAS